MAVPDVLDAATAAQIIVVAVIGVLTYRRDMLTLPGALTATVMGAAIVFFTNVWWLLLLFSLLAMGSLATRFKYTEKAKRKVAEKKGGRRGTRNVLANGLAPALVAVASPMMIGEWGAGHAAVAYASAIAVAAADTLASELGSLSDRVRMITTLKPVPAGTDGGVSLAGQIAALVGASLVTLLAAALLGGLTTGDIAMPVTTMALLIPVVMGWIGCQVDSILGATLEGGGIFTKEETNLTSILVGAIGGLALSVWLV